MAFRVGNLVFISTHFLSVDDIANYSLSKMFGGHVKDYKLKRGVIFNKSDWPTPK
jgi:hypothetical protein